MATRRSYGKEISGVVSAPNMIPRTESFEEGKNVTTENFTNR